MWSTRGGRRKAFLAGAASLALAVVAAPLAAAASPPGPASPPGLAAHPGAVRAATAPCDAHALQTALGHGGLLDFRKSCTLNLSKQLTVPAGDHVTLDGDGSKVTINGGSAAYQPLNVFTRVFLVSGTLTLENLTVAHGEAFGETAADGDDGATGKSGTSPGQGGGPGKPGHPGGDGGDGQGGGIYVKKGGTLTADHVDFTGDLAAGAPGGAGGIGGSGGEGGPAVNGSAGDGGMGADGGKAGDGGAAQGGAIYNLGKLTVIGGTFSDDHAFAGGGGPGGPGGPGGAAGEIQTPPGTFGNGGDGSDGGDGGQGGDAAGGAIYSSGSLLAEGNQFSKNSAVGGAAGIGGPGGNGGSGFCPSGNPADCGGNSGGDGGNGGDGGDGGNGAGGAVDGTGTVHLEGTAFSGDKVGGGTTGPDCNVPNPGCGGPAGGGGGFATTHGSPGDAGDNGKAGGANFPAANVKSTGLPPVMVTTKSLAKGRAGKSYHAALAAKGGIAPYKWGVKGLPNGLKTSAGGVISGKPVKAGSFRLTITVTDPTAAKRTTGRATLTLTVSR